MLHVSPPVPVEPAPRERVEAASFVLTLRARGVRDKTVLGAMERVPRDLFAPRRFADLARSDIALPLPCGQTMTAPSVVAAILVALGVEPGQRVLEIGTGSGYTTALLARLGCRIHTVERYAPLAEEAGARLAAAGTIGSIDVEIGDGLAPSATGARFDRILVNGAVAALPPAVTALLAPGGRLVGAILVEGLPRLVRAERSYQGTLSQELGSALRLTSLSNAEAGSLQRVAGASIRSSRATLA
jgi:protein-L-isoaspartate(D-aspartate) O-methyltransferase